MRYARCRVAVRAALPLDPERSVSYVHRRVAVYGVPSSEGHQRVPHAPKRPDGVLPHAGLSPEELQRLPLAMHAQLPGAPRPIGVDIRLFGGSCGLTPRRIASQRRTQVPHSATGDSRKGALWECHSHGKTHFSCGPHQKAHSACGRSRRVRLSVRVRAQSALFREVPVQNALFRRVRFSSPAQTWSHLTQRRILRRRSHVKAQSAPATSRKSTLCVWASPKGAFCMRAGVASRGRFRRPVYTPAHPRPLARPGGSHGSHDVEGPMTPVMHRCPDLRPMPPGR